MLFNVFQISVDSSSPTGRVTPIPVLKLTEETNLNPKNVLQESKIDGSPSSIIPNSGVEALDLSDTSEQNVEENNNDCDEFLSSLGSRLSKLTDANDKNCENVYKLVSVTPLSSSDGSIVLTSENLDVSSIPSSPVSTANEQELDLGHMSKNENNLPTLVTETPSAPIDENLNVQSKQDNEKSQTQSLMM